MTDNIHEPDDGHPQSPDAPTAGADAPVARWNERRLTKDTNYACALVALLLGWASYNETMGWPMAKFWLGCIGAFYLWQLLPMLFWGIVESAERRYRL